MKGNRGALIRIRFLIRDAPYEPGQVVMLPEKTAKRMVSAGRAEFVDAAAEEDSTDAVGE